MPDAYLVRFTETPQGRLRSRTLGETRPGVPPVVLVMGMAVSDYLLPAAASLAAWTRVHLVELPGLAGSGEPRGPMDAYAHAEAVVAWLDANVAGPVVMAGHSSGTQVAAGVAARRPERAVGLVLGGPTVDPVHRSMPRVVRAWTRDSRYPMPGLRTLHLPQWRRAGLRRILAMTRAYLRGPQLEDAVPRLEMPVLVLRGIADGMSTEEWARGLGGRFVAVPGPHTFVWEDPDAWSAPIRELALRTSGRGEDPS